MSSNVAPNSAERARPEARIEERAGVWVGHVLAEQVDAVELSGVGVRQEGVLGHGHELRADAEIGKQLGLELGGDAARIREIRPPRVDVLDLRVEPVRKTGRGEHLLAEDRVEFVPRVAGAAVRDGTGRVVGGELRAGREVRLDDALAVDAHRDRLADPLVVERGEGVGEADIGDVQPGARLEGQADVVRHRRDGAREDVVDPVDGRVLELGEALTRRSRTSGRSGARSGPRRPSTSSLRARLTSEPWLQLSSRYGPVPLTSLTIACAPVVAGSMCDSSQPASLIAKAGAAIFERNATSGPHSSKTTVSGSVELIRRIWPV